MAGRAPSVVHGALRLMTARTARGGARPASWSDANSTGLIGRARFWRRAWDFFRLQPLRLRSNLR
jgi:hypothetical protein